MELRQLEYLVAVVEEASFSRAAQRVHVTQPGVSAQIRQLERELGQPLLDRSGRSVRPTEAGASVLPYARAALAAATGARHAVDELTGLLRGRLTVGTVGAISTTRFDLTAMVTAFHTDHPNVRITLTVASSTELIEQTRGGECDLALVGLGTHTPTGLDTLDVTDEPLIAAVGADHPLAGRATIALPTLVKHPLITLHQGTGIRTSIDDACAAAGLRPEVTCEVAEPPVAIQLARHGLGVAVVPVTVPTHDTHPVPITRPQLRSRIALAWRTDGPINPAARAFLRRAHALVAPQQDGH